MTRQLRNDGMLCYFFMVLSFLRTIIELSRAEPADVLLLEMGTWIYV